MNNKTLIVYFSEFGTTEKFAKAIQERTKGDIFKIEPVKEYMTGYDELANYSKAERDNNERPEFKGTIEDISKYDTIFIGYPMWWYTFPMIIRTFLDKYDLTEKKVIPFNTHEGSGDGGTYKELQEYIPNAKVEQNGLAIRGGDMEREGSSKINDWLDKLGF